MSDKTKIWFPIFRIVLCVAVVAITIVLSAHFDDPISFLSKPVILFSLIFLVLMFVWSVADLIIIYRRIIKAKAER